MCVFYILYIYIYIYIYIYTWLSLTYGWAEWIYECSKDCQVITLASCHCGVRLTGHTSTASGVPNRRLFWSPKYTVSLWWHVRVYLQVKGRPRHIIIIIIIITIIIIHYHHHKQALRKCIYYSDLRSNAYLCVA